MVFCYPSTPKKLAITIACFLGGASLFVVGVHLSYVNIAPQQARIKARNDFVKERLRKKHGSEYFSFVASQISCAILWRMTFTMQLFTSSAGTFSSFYEGDCRVAMLWYTPLIILVPSVRSIMM